MKYFSLILLAAGLAVVCEGVVTPVPNLWTPIEGVDHKCMMCGDPIVRTPSGRYIYVEDLAKVKLMEFLQEEKHECKFQIHCVTAIVDGVKSIDWCGIAIWTHSADHKFFRNFVFGQLLTCVGIRGQAFRGPNHYTLVDLGGGVYEVFPFPDPIYDDLTEWNPNVLRPDPVGCYPYYITRTDDSLILTSDAACGCGWAVQFFPRGKDTCVNVYMDATHTSRVGQVDGICGLMTGNPEDDRVTCQDSDGNRHPAATDAEITATCKDKKHQGQNYIYGSKIGAICSKNVLATTAVPAP